MNYKRTEFHYNYNNYSKEYREIKKFIYQEALSYEILTDLVILTQTLNNV